MEITSEDVNRIKLTRSFFQIFVHYFYFLFKRFTKYKQKVLDELVLFDDGMMIVDSFVPYEYIVSVCSTEMILSAKFEDGKIVPSDSLVQVKFDKKINSQIIKNNMYYHLKYNTVNTDIFNFKSVKFSLRM